MVLLPANEVDKGTIHYGRLLQRLRSYNRRSNRGNKVCMYVPYAHGLWALALVPPPWLRPFSVSGFDLSSGFILRADHAEVRAHPAKLKSEISAVEHLRRVLRVRIKRTVKAKQEKIPNSKRLEPFDICCLGTLFLGNHGECSYRYIHVVPGTYPAREERRYLVIK
jgi:hypothetical protein